MKLVEIGRPSLEHWSERPLNDIECTACSLHKTARTIGVGWYGCHEPDILIVGEAPGRDEDRFGRPFIGKSGSLLKDCLEKAGISLDRVAFSNIVQCIPYLDPSYPYDGVRPPTDMEMRTCSTRLLREIVHLRPRVIVPVGGTSGWFFLRSPGQKKTAWKITEKRGRIGEVRIGGVNYPVVPTIHPASVLRSPSQEPQFVNDLRVALRVSQGTYGHGLPKTVVAENTSHALEIIQACEKAYDEGRTKHVSFDLETTSFFPWDKNARILGIALAYERGTGYYIPVDHHGVGRVPLDSLPQFTLLDRRRVLDAFKRLISRVPMSNQNIKFDIVWIMYLWGMEPSEVYADPLTMSHLLFGELRDRQNSLKVLVRDAFGYPEYEKEIRTLFKEIEEDDYSRVPLDMMRKYAGVDAEGAWRLVELFLPYIESEGLLLPFHIVNASSLAFADMEVTGVSIDLDKLSSIRDEYLDRMRKNIKVLCEKDPQVNRYLDLEEAHRVAAEQEKKRRSKAKLRGWRETFDLLYYSDTPLKKLVSSVGFNPNSDKQVGKILYDAYGIEFQEKWKTEKGGRSVKKEVLEEIDKLLDEEHIARRFVSETVSYRQDMKILGSYLNKLPDYVREDGTLQVKYLITGTVTGRLSTRDFSLHTMPKGNRSPIKKAFVSRWRDDGETAFKRVSNRMGPKLPGWFDAYPEHGGGLFASVDFSQLELRCLAACSGDESMIQAFIDGKDLHQFVASRVFYPSVQRLSSQDPRSLWKSHCYFAGVKTYVDLLESKGFKELATAPVEVETDYGVKKTDHAALGRLGCNLEKVDLQLLAVRDLLVKDPVFYETLRYAAVTKAQRSFAKAIGFGVVYGSQAESIAAKAEEMDTEEALAFIDEYFSLFPKVLDWIKEQHRTVMKPREIWALGGKIITHSNWSPVGWVRHFPGAGSSRAGEVNAAKREAQNCVDAETEILTRSGWKSYDQVFVGEEILTKNPERGSLEWKPILDLHVYPVSEGPLVEMSSKAFSAVTTLNHRWLVTDRKTGKDVFKTSAELCPFGFHSIHRTGDYLGPEETYPDDFVRFMGWWLTDGCLTKVRSRAKGAGPNDLRKTPKAFICQSERGNKSKCDRINALFQRTGLLAYKNIDRSHGCWKWYVPGVMARALQEVFPDRKLTPDFLNRLSGRQARLLVETMIDGDGHRERSVDGLVRKVTLACRDKDQADLFQFACMLAGYATTSRMLNGFWRRPSRSKKMNNSPRTGTYWVVTVLRRKTAQVTRAQRRLLSDSRLVWCPRVENSTWIARRRGCVYVTGNSPIQNSAAILCVMSILLLGNVLAKKKLKSLIVGSVHDSILFDLYPGEIAAALPEIVECMEKTSTQQVGFEWIGDVPIVVDVELGESWGDAVEAKPLPDNRLLLSGPTAALERTEELLSRGHRLKVISSTDYMDKKVEKRKREYELGERDISLWSIA